MKILSSFVLVLAASAAQAALKPAAASAATAAVPPAPAAAAKRFPGVSDAGNAILAKAQSTPDPQQAALLRQAKSAHDQLIAAVMAPVIDIDKVTAALRAEEAVQGEARTHANDRLLAVLKQLPDDDKGTFMRTLLLARQQRPAGAPASGATPQP